MPGLVLSRDQGESIIINDNIKVTILDVRYREAKILIEAPQNLEIWREEVWKKRQQEKALKDNAEMAREQMKYEDHLDELSKYSIPDLKIGGVEIELFTELGFYYDNEKDCYVYVLDPKAYGEGQASTLFELYPNGDLLLHNKAFYGQDSFDPFIFTNATYELVQEIIDNVEHNEVLS